MISAYIYVPDGTKLKYPPGCAGGVVSKQKRQGGNRSITTYAPHTTDQPVSPPSGNSTDCCPCIGAPSSLSIEWGVERPPFSKTDAADIDVPEGGEPDL